MAHRGSRLKKIPIGSRFGKLVVIDGPILSSLGSPKGAAWRCQCDCGNLTTAFGTRLRDGRKQSCGCSRYEGNGKYSDRGVKHDPGLRRTYCSWVQMKGRCTNPKTPTYGNYGGRGITICNRWLHSFENFLEDMGIRPERTTLGRKNNDGNYTPKNCRWETAEQQIGNRRTTIWVVFEGKRQRLSDLCRRFGLGTSMVRGRLCVMGWSVEEALTTPVRPKKPNRK